jgi:PKD repeat protein
MKWFGTRYGVARFDGSNWVRYNQSNSDLPFDEVKAIAVDMVGNKWFGTDGAAGVLHGGASVLYGGTDHAIADNPQWLDATHYRATYDFSTLIPRGVYAITISGARTPETTGSGTTILPIPGGGMEIAPNSAYTFTVDYAGYINDTTAPPAPTVIACATATPDTLSATWAGYDPESAINQYQYAIGFARDGIEVVSWTFTPLTETTRVSLTLVIGQTYYISVKARNEGGIWSEAGSVGVVAGSDTCVGAQPASPEVDFAGMPRSGDAPLDVHFTGIVTGEVTSYAWSFGDGGITTTANPMHTYTNAGSFSVSLVVTGPGGTAQTVKPEYITVNPPPGAPTATFSANVVSGTVPLAVTFTAIPSGTIEGWYWSFGDSTVAITGPVVQHTYQIPGVFDVSLTVSNTYGSYTANKPGYITVSSSGGGHRVYLPLVLRN